jgi:hypothetical protein
VFETSVSCARSVARARSWAVYPPSIAIAAPVTNELSSEGRNPTSGDTSSTLATRPIGCSAAICAADSSVAPIVDRKRWGVDPCEHQRVDAHVASGELEGSGAGESAHGVAGSRPPSAPSRWNPDRMPIVR